MAKRCAICSRELKVVDDVPRYVTSGFTKNHYCMPGEGCWLNVPTIDSSAETKEGTILIDHKTYPKDLSAESTEAISAPVLETSITPN